MLAKSSFKHLLPRADKGSACKRIHLYLRWMVRPGTEGVDFGLWRRVDPSKLLIPVDTHILRIAKNLGFLPARTQTTLRAARKVTEALKKANLADPVRYDFALCRLGILKKCPPASRLEQCRECDLHAICRRRQSLERRSVPKKCLPRRFHA